MANLLIKTLLAVIAVLAVLFLFLRGTDFDIGLLSDITGGNTGLNSGIQDNNGDEQDETDTGQRIHIVDGFKAILVEEDIITAAGLRFAQPIRSEYIPEFTAHAEVIDIAPLVDFRTRYLNLQAEIRVLQNDLHNHDLILKRARALYESKSLPTRELEKTRADRDLKASELAAMNTRLDNLEFDIKSAWGEEISRMILDPGKKSLFDRLAAHETALVQVSLLKDRTLSDVRQKVYVSNRNRRETAIEAVYLDQAVRVKNQLYGESYIYQLDTGKFRPGIRLFAWIDEGSKPLSGLLIPDSAVIWYANEAWIYIRKDEHLFVRKPLKTSRKLADSWFVQEGINIDDQMVIHGGQTLLSEEFKWAIPDEDDD